MTPFFDSLGPQEEASLEYKGALKWDGEAEWRNASPVGQPQGLVPYGR